MDFLDIIDKHSQIIAGVIATLGGISLTWVKIKNYIIKTYNKRKEYVRSRAEIPSILKNIQNSVSNIDIRLSAVEKEIKPNGGGSMKDALKIIKAEIESIFWLNPKPSFRTTSKGMNIQVNEAYCHLCGTTSEELLRLNWRNFIEDEQQLEEYYDRWMQSAETFSQLSGKLKFKNSRGEYVGEWMVKIRPLGPIENGTDYLWHGTIYPSDQKSKEYAKNFNIPLN